MTVFSVLTFAEQGVFNLVNSLGSGSARFLLMPIDETSYFYFAQMTNRQVPIEQQPRKEVEQVAGVLHRLLRSLCLICIILLTSLCLMSLYYLFDNHFYSGLILIVFGSSYAHLLLLNYGGVSLADGPGPVLLRVHFVCVLCMAINGVTEAYVFASMTPEQLNQHNRKMVVLSLLYLGSAWLFSRIFGGVGFILANIINHGLRIVQRSLFFYIT